VSAIRPNSNPWLADHVIFVCYRWLAWAAAALPFFWPGRPAAYGWALLATGLLNLPATFFAQGYVRVARRTPAIMALDVFYMVLALHLLRISSGGADGSELFVLYAYSSLVLPALLFGWRGGIMAGLAFVTMDRAALWSASRPVADMTARDWADLALMMVAPPAFGCVFPFAIGLLRRVAARRARRRSQQREPFVGEQIRRDMPADPLNFTTLEHDTTRGSAAEPVETSLSTQTTKVHAVEPSVEDLRRILFAPFPSPDMDLADVLELLTLRFGQHTGAATRIVMLGRTRRLHPAHRDMLVRLAQEALLNIQQHAHAASTVCTLRYDSASAVLLIQDDGVGLLDGTYERPRLHALRAIHYRLAELGGRLDVFETEGGGLTVRATMPLE
jgi:glucose-6-phosphate-specific signal transduction histidine kinase